jgi:hypothetical protein
MSFLQVFLTWLIDVELQNISTENIGIIIHTSSRIYVEVRLKKLVIVC